MGLPIKVDGRGVSAKGISRALNNVPESSVWLANFTSGRTRRTYRMAILEFAAAMGFKSEDAWREVKPAHVIAWRKSMEGRGMSDRTIHTRVSALSSLFKHLCEKQMVRDNPVRSVRRPQVNSDQVESVVMTKKQAAALLSAPPGTP